MLTIGASGLVALVAALLAARIALVALVAALLAARIALVTLVAALLAALTPPGYLVAFVRL